MNSNLGRWIYNHGGIESYHIGGKISNNQQDLQVVWRLDFKPVWMDFQPGVMDFLPGGKISNQR